MPTKLKKPVVRMVDVPLRPNGFRGGFVARLSDEGVYLKPPKGRWSKAFLATWGDVLTVAAMRKADEAKRARAAKRAARKAGLA